MADFSFEYLFELKKGPQKVEANLGLSYSFEFSLLFSFGLVNMFERFVKVIDFSYELNF